MVEVRYVGDYRPEHATKGSAAFDLKSTASLRLPPGCVTRVPLGMRVALNEGDVLLLTIRSGLASKGLLLANGIGVIDSDYRGEIAALIFNSTTTEVWVEEGQRVVQCMITTLPFTHWVPVHELPPSSRGEGGFGSTGT